MRKCTNGHISFGKSVKCKRCNSNILFPGEFWRYGKIDFYTKGSASEVYRVRGKDSDYILKVTLREKSQAAYDCAKDEIRMLQRLTDCKHVVELVDYKIEDDAVYLLEPYYVNISQASLPGFNKWNYFKEESILKKLGMDICQALIECRDKGIYQLDIQPRNLYLDANGYGRLGDFSIALKKEQLENRRDLRGTLAYMAPEVFKERQYSEQAEIYSLGFLLYCMLNEGRMPFSDTMEPKASIQKRLSGEQLPFIGNKRWMDFINKACAFKREERFATLEECLEALKKLPLTYEYKPGEAVSKGVSAQAAEEKLLKIRDQEKVAGALMAFLEREIPGEKKVPGEEEIVSVPGTSKEEGMPDVFDPFDADEYAKSLLVLGDGETFPMFDADEFAMTLLPFEPESFEQNSGTRGESKKPDKLDKVQFSAVAPKEFVKGEYTLVDIFMYEEEYQHVVEEYIQQADTEMSATKTGFYEVEKNVNVKIVLSSPDIEIEDAVEEGIWTGRYLNFSFAVEVPNSYAKRQILFVATMYIDGVITAKLKFVAKMTSLREQKLQVLKEDILSVFVSYASQDRQRVAQVIQGMKKARPEMDVFFDVNSLRSGEEWENILQYEIEKRDILFLCWSKYAKASEWVSKEWHYALENKGAESIEPIPLEPPTECPPPEELKHKHFNDAMLFIINQ